MRKRGMAIRKSTGKRVRNVKEYLVEDGKRNT
jgi:hypothetical protein